MERFGLLSQFLKTDSNYVRHYYVWIIMAQDRVTTTELERRYPNFASCVNISVT